MALEACRECGKEVSTDSRACPHCGKKDPTKGPIAFLFEVIMAVCLLISILFWLSLCSAP